MKIRSTLVILLLLLSAVSINGSDQVEGLPIHMKRIAPDVLRLWAGDHISSTAVTAMATRKGIVVIDTTEIPEFDQAFRNIIAREFKRTDFKYLINTHGHADHTNGNGVYADCRIIAHEAVPEMMKDNVGNVQRLREWYQNSIVRQKEQIDSGKFDEGELAVAKERLILNTLTLRYMNASPKPVFPNETFRDHYTLDCDDTTFELYQSGGTHTRSDIFIFVPQKKILFTGDMMADKWLTDTPGCLATYAVRSGALEDYPILVKNWQALIDRKEDIEHYIPGHWNGELSFQGFKDRFEYLKTMLKEMKTFSEGSGDLSRYYSENTLKAKFPHLVDSPGFSNQGHRMTINHLYQIYTGKIPVIDELQRLLQSSNFKADFTALRDSIMKDKNKYFFNEAEINNFGYYLLNQMKQTENAVSVFEMNLQLFPSSWNVHDSVAEGYLAQGEKKRALEFYKKSVELNPENENGKKVITQIEKELSN